MDCQLRRVECPQGLQSCPWVSVIPIRADKNAAVGVADSSGAGSGCAYGMGIAQAVAQLDDYACGGTDKGPSIHSISRLIGSNATMTAVHYFSTAAADN